MKHRIYVAIFLVSACGRPEAKDDPQLCDRAVCASEEGGTEAKPQVQKTGTKPSVIEATAKPPTERDHTIKPTTNPGDAGPSGATNTGTTDEPIRDARISADEKDVRTEVPHPSVPPFVAVEDVVLAGTGCPLGTADLSYLHDGKTFELSTSDLFAEARADSPRRDRRRACQVLFAIDHTPGWQYAIEAVLLSSHVELEAETTGTLKVSSYVQGDDNTNDITFNIAGPVFDSLDLDATPEPTWSPCDEDRAINLKVDTRIHGNPEPQGLIEVGNPVEIRLQWRECVPE